MTSASGTVTTLSILNFTAGSLVTKFSSVGEYVWASAINGNWMFEFTMVKSGTNLVVNGWIDNDFYWTANHNVSVGPEALGGYQNQMFITAFDETTGNDTFAITISSKGSAKGFTDPRTNIWPDGNNGVLVTSGMYSPSDDMFTWGTDTTPFSIDGFVLDVGSDGLPYALNYLP